MGTDDRYNGWTNRETWAVALHINNDEGWQESVLDAVRSANDEFTQSPPIWAVFDNEYEEARDRAIRAGRIVQDSVEEWLEYLSERDNDTAAGDLWSIASDIGSLWRVNWTELGAAFLEDLEG